MMKIKEIVSYLESVAPPSLQESYDNAGLLTGDINREVSSALICLEVTPVVLDEAIDKGIEFIISHHPLIFTGLKKLTGENQVERMIIRAIQNGIAIFAAHTNLDAVVGGLNSLLAEKAGIKNARILKPKQGHLLKLVTFVPAADVEKVRDAVFSAGAGTIGNYDSCSFNTSGQGSFRAGEGTHPYAGEKGKLHFEDELRIETVFPRHIKSLLINALLNAHPYEEVAYDIYPIENDYPMAGMGMIGELQESLNEKDFLDRLKKTLDIHTIRHTGFLNKAVRKVAVCGGAGSFLLGDAMRQGADVFVSADFTYHKFFEAENKILIADIGHYESEQLVKEVFSDLIKKKFPTFAAQISEVNTNPINYY